MKYLTEFRNSSQALRLIQEIQKLATRRWAIMEVCGGQTHSIIRHGIDQVLMDHVELIHGPGCPVCVTPLETIDRALAIAERPEVIFCTFADMLRVPGSERDLFSVKAAGGDVRIVYSPLDAVRIARQHPHREVVLFAIGFETTAPANAMAVKVARQQHLTNFSMLVSHVLVPPAMRAIMQSPATRVDAFLAAGHVCSVMGIHQYPELTSAFQVPIIITGFELLDILDGIYRAVRQLESGVFQVENAYARAVSSSGNSVAKQVLQEVFTVTDRKWRGIGTISASGWALTADYQNFDAERRFDINIQTQESSVCRCGEVLQGTLKPSQCAAFAKECTPRTPLGATMVSGEGACAAYYNYGRLRPLNETTDRTT